MENALKGILTDEIYLEKFDNPKINKGQRQIKEYDYNEIKKAIDFVIHGEYKLPYNNFISERGLSIKALKSKKTVIYLHEKIDFALSLNQHKNFPKLKKSFIADAIKVFDKPEIKNLNDNKEFVKSALNFFSKYGTHFLNRTKYGSRFVWISEVNLTKWDNQPASDTPQDSTSFKSGSIAFENSRDKKNDRLSDFEISAELGNCEINMLENKMEKCNATLSSVGLLGFEVEYLYRIFDAEKINVPILQPDNLPLSADRIKNIHINMRMMLDSLTSAIDIRNLYIRDIISYNNFKADYGDALPCTKNFKIPRFGNIPNSLFYYDYRDNRFMPVFKVSHINKINFKNFYLINKFRQQTFLCNLKDRLFDNTIIESPYLFNKRYLNDIALFHHDDFSEGSPNKNKTLGYRIEDCQDFWVGIKSDFQANSNIKILLICFKYANVFLDNKIITDIKIKTFINNECTNFSRNGKDYECLCDQEIKQMSQDESEQTNQGSDVNNSNSTQAVFIEIARKKQDDGSEANNPDQENAANPDAANGENAPSENADSENSNSEANNANNSTSTEGNNNEAANAENNNNNNSTSNDSANDLNSEDPNGEATNSTVINVNDNTNNNLGNNSNGNANNAGNNEANNNMNQNNNQNNGSNGNNANDNNNNASMNNNNNNNPNLNNVNGNNANNNNINNSNKSNAVDSKKNKNSFNENPMRNKNIKKFICFSRKIFTD